MAFQKQFLGKFIVGPLWKSSPLRNVKKFLKVPGKKNFKNSFLNYKWFLGIYIESNLPKLDPFPTYLTVNKETPDGRSFGFGKSFLLSAAFLSCSNVDDGNKTGDEEEDDEEEEVVSETETVDANENPDEDFDEDVATAYDFLLSKEDLGKVKTELIEGDESGSKWLVLDDVYILYKYGYEGKDETLRECSERTQNKCRFKGATVAGDDLENPTPSYSENLCCCCC